MSQAASLLAGAVVLGLVFGPLFLRPPQAGQALSTLQGFRSFLSPPPTWCGVVRSVAVPAFWIVLLYAFVGHLYCSLGRWPQFGEPLRSPVLDFHFQVVWKGAGILVMSIVLTPLLLLACLGVRRWRPIAVHLALYVGAVGLAVGSLYLSPGPFLNWWFD